MCSVCRYADSPDPKKVIAYLEEQKQSGRPGRQQRKKSKSTTIMMIQVEKGFKVLSVSQDCIFSPAAGFYVSGLNLTEDAPYVLHHPLQTMRKMTLRALSLLLAWVSEQRPGPEVGGVNIVCCDFVDVGRFCSVVVDLNYKLLRERGPLAVCRMPGRCLPLLP